MSSGYDIKGRVVLITGANRGIGKAFVECCLKHGASKVYAAVRNLDTAKIFEDESKVTPLYLDLSKPESIIEAAQQAEDVQVLINNAGVLSRSSPLSPDAVEQLKDQMSVNVYGLMHVAQHFTPILKNNGGGVIVQINSVASFRNGFFDVAQYSASKAAAYSITQGLKQSLASEGIRVLSVHPGPIATDMIAAASEELAKAAEDPLQVAEEVVAALQIPDQFHVYPDSKSKQLGEIYQQYAKPVIEDGKMYG